MKRLSFSRISLSDTFLMFPYDILVYLDSIELGPFILKEVCLVLNQLSGSHCWLTIIPRGTCSQVKGLNLVDS